MAGNSGNVPTENISEVILRLLKLNPGTELDYQTYASLIKKKLTSARMIGKGLPAEEDILLREEFKKVRNKKGRFKVKEKTTRVSTPPPPSRGPSGGGGGGGMPPKSGSIVKSQQGKITADKFFYQNYVQPVTVKDVTEKTVKVSKKSDPLENINKTLDSILKTLTDINKEDRKAREKQRVDTERKQREEKEKGMESRSFEGLKKAISAVTKPFQSIFDRIINFIFYTLLGRAVMKLIDWFADPKNQGKIQSLIRFFVDHWPTLLALYLRFGTGFGRFIGKLGGVLVKGAFKLGALAAKLAAKAGLKKFAGAAKFLGGPRGKALATGIGIAADVAVTAGTAIGIKNLVGGDKETPVQQFSGGGFVKYPKFAGGGFANFGKMFGGVAMGAGLGSMFGPLGMLLGAGLGGAAGSGMFSGMVKGQKGKDKVPAMLTDGEFVMSTGAVQKYGVETLEAMNAAGGGTNVPKVVSGKTYAEGGGYIGGVREIRRKYDAKHGEGAYDRESARRRSEINNASNKPVLPPLKTDSEYINQLRSKAKKGTSNYTSVNGIRIPGVKFDPKTFSSRPSISGGISGGVSGDKIAKGVESKAKGIFGSISAATGIGSGKLTPEQQKKIAQDNAERNKIIQDAQQKRDIAKKAREEYTKIISDVNHPDYDRAWNEPKFLDSLKAKYGAEAATPSGFKSGTGYKPYVSRFAGARDSKFAEIRGQDKPRFGINRYNPMTWGKPGGMFGGPRMQARTDYAKSKGKYYSSSDQKTYGNYNDAMAAKKSRMTSLASQQRLNKLSSQGAGPKTGRGIRYTTEAVASERERIKRGGIMGQLGRLGTRIFGGESGRQRVAAQDAASTARVKQAGAASIGRYYSSSDGKYYKDYNAAVLAKKQRVKSGVKPLPKPKPKPQVAGGGMGGKRGSGSSPSVQKAPSPSPRHKAGTKTTERTTGTKR